MDKIVTPTQQIATSARHHRRLSGYMLLIFINCLVFCYTTPLSGPTVVAIGGFLLVSVDMALLWHAMVGFSCLFFPWLKQHRRRLTVLLASLSTVAIALASLGQLTLRDMTVVLIIGVVGYLYSLRFTFHQK